MTVKWHLSPIHKSSCGQCSGMFQMEDTESEISKWADIGSVGESSCLAVGRLPGRFHPGWIEVSLSYTHNPQFLLTSWSVPCMECEWACESIVQDQLYSTLDKSAI